jgi:hypothetical protein
MTERSGTFATATRRLGSLMLAAAVLAGCTSSAEMTPPMPTDTTRPNPAETGITREAAIAIARAAVPRYATADTLTVEMGRLADLLPSVVVQHLSPPPTPDTLVWKITLGEQPSPTGGQGTDVYIDSSDGRVLLTSDWAS